MVKLLNTMKMLWS